MARTRLYRNGALEAEDFPVAEVSDRIADPATTVWFDLCAPAADDLATIGEELGLHTLAVEDVLQGPQRPKVDRYPTHMFVTCYAVRLDTASGALQTSEVDVFVTANALVTVRQDDGFDIDEVVSRWDGSPELARYGVAFLLHGVLDYAVDTQFAAVESLDEQIENLEDELFADRPGDQEVQRRTFELRKSLVMLRRIILPTRELVDSLGRRDLRGYDDAMTPYFEDVYDHALRASEWTESLRDLVTTILDTHLALRSNRLNVITKQVTSWAAIIAVPTAVTGFYGQNVPYPGYGQPAGFLTSTVVILAMSTGLYVVFRRKGWL
jgi:magnesium transporter